MYVDIPGELRDEDAAIRLVEAFAEDPAPGRARYSGAYFELLGGGGPDFIAACGVSGLLVGAPVACELGKPLVVVRRSYGESVHATKLVVNREPAVAGTSSMTLLHRRHNPLYARACRPNARPRSMPAHMST